MFKRLVDDIKNKDYRTVFFTILSIILAVLLVILVVMFGFKSKKLSYLEDKFASIQTDIVYYTDSVKTYKDKNDKLLYEKQLIEHDKEVLSKDYKDILAEFKRVSKLVKKDQKSPIVVIKTDLIVSKDNSTQSQDSSDSLSVVKIIQNSSTDSQDSLRGFTYSIKYSDSSTDLVSRLVLRSLQDQNPKFYLDSFKYRTSLNYSILEDSKGNLSVLVSSPDSSIEVADIQGSLFSISESKFVESEINKRLNVLQKKYDLERKKRFSVGLNAGYGVMLQPTGSEFKFVSGPYVGVGVSWNLFNF